jgi:general stress protein 26
MTHKQSIESAWNRGYDDYFSGLDNSAIVELSEGVECAGAYESGQFAAEYDLNDCVALEWDS